MIWCIRADRQPEEKTTTKINIYPGPAV